MALGGSGIARSLPPLLLLAASAAATPLTPAQRQRLTAVLACPNRLADDPARLRNVERFVALHTRFAPRAHMGERLALRDALLRRKGCGRRPDPFQYHFPED